MNNSPSNLMKLLFMSQKIFKYKESIEDYFYDIILYYRDFYAFNDSIGDALMRPRHFKINQIGQ